jgi:hypothetical protein
VSEVVVRRQLPVAAADVVAVLRARPTRWLRPFLLLAVSTSGPRVSDSRRVWYRLGDVEFSDRTASVALTWWPHAGPEYFERFRGTLTVSAANHGATVQMAGQTEDGHEAFAESAGGALLDLLGSALAAR